MKCPICKAPSAEKFAPFCSKACSNRDLNSWFNGSYAIPLTPLDDEDGEHLESPKLAPDE